MLARVWCPTKPEIAVEILGLAEVSARPGDARAGWALAMISR
jgi:hypothetical protein